MVTGLQKNNGRGIITSCLRMKFFCSEHLFSSEKGQYWRWTESVSKRLNFHCELSLANTRNPRETHATPTPHYRLEQWKRRFQTGPTTRAEKSTEIGNNRSLTIHKSILYIDNHRPAPKPLVRGRGVCKICHLINGSYLILNWEVVNVPWTIFRGWKTSPGRL